MGSLARQLKRDSLEKELVARQRDFEAVDKKYRRETNPAEKNALKDQRDDLLVKIQDLDEQLQDLGFAREQELIEILQSAYQQCQDAILLAYRCSIPSRQILASNTRELSLSQLIVNLQLLGNGETHTPLHKFIGFLLFDQRPESDRKERLRTWIREELEDLSPLLAEVEQEKQNREREENPYLLVAISKREAQYVAEAWIISHPEDYDSSQSVSGCHQIKIDGKAQWSTDPTLANMPALLRQFRDSCVENHCERSVGQIHIFVPSELISHGIDTWKSDADEDDELSMTFGERYEVIVRYSERLGSKTESILKWREKGQKMKQRLPEPASCVFLPGDCATPKRLLKQLIADSAIAVKVTSTTQLTELGKLLLKSGIPLAVWIRNTMPNVDCPTELDYLLGACPELQTLPGRVHSTRLEAFDEDEPDSHVGRHLALLWDDPDLVPPKQLLTQRNLQPSKP